MVDLVLQVLDVVAQLVDLGLQLADLTLLLVGEHRPGAGGVVRAPGRARSESVDHSPASPQGHVQRHCLPALSFIRESTRTPWHRGRGSRLIVLVTAQVFQVQVAREGALAEERSPSARSRRGAAA